jgi:hypothetical protein
VLYERSAEAVDYGEESRGGKCGLGAFEGEKIGFVGLDPGLELIYPFIRI